MNLVSIEQKKNSCVFLLKCVYCPLPDVMNGNKHMYDGNTTWMQLAIWIDLNNMDEMIFMDEFDHHPCGCQMTNHIIFHW
jgi:hypothetical protein